MSIFSLEDQSVIDQAVREGVKNHGDLVAWLHGRIDTFCALYRDKDKVEVMRDSIFEHIVSVKGKNRSLTKRES